uniref:FAST kinase domain-containing protein 5 n=1 Tax=Cacopsylla melanoneura TaxID=428564 RepID=A0A8D8M406_9HEMI
MFTKHLNHYQKFLSRSRADALFSPKNSITQSRITCQIHQCFDSLATNIRSVSTNTWAVQGLSCHCIKLTPTSSNVSLISDSDGLWKLTTHSNLCTGVSTKFDPFVKNNLNQLSIPTVRSFSTSCHNFSSTEEHKTGYKVYHETENKLLYAMVSRIPELKDSLAPVFTYVEEEDLITDSEFEKLTKTDFSNADKSDILESFKKITYYMYEKEDNLTHPSFDNICQALVSSIKDLSNDDICKLMYLLQIWSPKCYRKDRNYFDIFAEIDKIQIERLSQGNNYYSLDQLLLLIDFWSHLNLLRSSNFCKLGLRKLLNKSHQLNAKQFVQVMFYHCRNRTFHPLVNTYEVELTFEKRYDQLTPQEIAIVLLAFFKSEKQFNNKNIPVKVGKTFIKHAQELDSISINGFLKSLKFYFPFAHWNIMHQVCDKLCQILDNHSHQVLANAATVSTKIDVYHADLINKVVEKAIENKDLLRIKDFEKVLFPVMIYNHKLKQPELVDIVTEEFLSDKRQPEVAQYPKTIISLVHHLIMLNSFNHKLIAMCMDLEFLHESFGKKLSGYNLPKELLAIDFSVAIEAPEYTGPRLPENLRHILCKHYAWRKPGELFHNQVVKSDELGISIMSKLTQLLGGKEYVHLAYVLPHFIRPDILFCVKDGKPVPIPVGMTDFVYMNPHPPVPTGKWYAIVLMSFSHQVKNTENHYKGNFMCKTRQLKKLGYEPIVVSAFEWTDETEQVRDKILRDKILGFLNTENTAVSVEG